MAELSVAGAFMITIGTGQGPEVKVFVSANYPDGSPFHFDSSAPQVEIFTGLTAMFGTSSFPCDVTEVQTIYPPPNGFVGLTVELRWVRELGRLSTLGLGALGVIVADGSDRGQGVIGPVGAAMPQTWWSEQTENRPQEGLKG
jgi:hypothetical protein